MTGLSALALAELPSAIGHNQMQGGERDAIIDAFTKILLEDRSNDVPSFLDAIFDKTVITTDGCQAAPDIVLADLFLFPEERIPIHNNLFNADLGNLIEKLIITLFSMTRGQVVDASKASMDALKDEYAALASAAKRRGTVVKPPSWKKPDFLLGVSTVTECKYRFNSYQSKQQQIMVAKAYQMLGLSPVFLHISPDFKHRKEFEEVGWEVHVAEDAIDYVEQHTGYDLRDLFQEVSAQPVVRSRIDEGHRMIIERQKARLWADYAYAPGDVRDDFVDRFCADEHSLRSIATRIDTEPPPGNPASTDLDPARLRDWTDTHCDQALKTLPQDKYGALLSALMTLEEDQRAELLSEALRQSSDNTQMSVMSVIG